MSMQCDLTLEERKVIFDIIESHGIDIVWGEDDGKELFNEVTIHISDEEGMKYYIQVN